MGGDGSGDVPWLFDGGRQIPNISSFKVPDYAVITNRIKRHAGVALIDAFAGDERDFACLAAFSAGGLDHDDADTDRQG